MRKGTGGDKDTARMDLCGTAGSERHSWICVAQLDLWAQLSTRPGAPLQNYTTSHIVIYCFMFCSQKRSSQAELQRGTRSFPTEPEAETLRVKGTAGRRGERPHSLRQGLAGLQGWKTELKERGAWAGLVAIPSVGYSLRQRPTGSASHEGSVRKERDAHFSVPLCPCRHLVFLSV